MTKDRPALMEQSRPFLRAIGVPEKCVRLRSG